MVGCGDYVEQPCRTVAELRSLKQQFPSIRLAADEALRRDREFDRVSQFADVAIVKIAPLGGLAAVRRLIADLDVEVVVSGAAESSVGLSRDVVAAAEFGAPDAVHGLGTGMLLAEDLVADPVVPRGGVVPACRVPTDVVWRVQRIAWHRPIGGTGTIGSPGPGRCPWRRV